jgi:hypothetical protein
LKRSKIQLFLNDKLTEGAIAFSYFSFERDIPLESGRAETEQDYHRILVYVNSMDLIKRAEENVGLWCGVTTIKFHNDLVSFGYRAYDKYENLVAAKLIPISNLCEVNIYSRLTSDMIAEQAKIKKSLSKEQAEELR